MLTCKELSALISQETDGTKKSKLEDKLAAREKSHRDPLKSREKSLRGKESTPLAELLKLLRECEVELPEDDSILKRVRASVFSKENHLAETLENKFRKKNLTVRLLSELLLQSENDLRESQNQQSLDLLSKVRLQLENRKKTHRVPLENEIAMAGDLPLKELSRLRQKLFLELPDDDNLFLQLDKAEKQRESTVKAKLVAKFKDIIKDMKKVKPKVVQEFYDACSEELDENDALLSQVKSTLSEKLLDSKGLKQVHNLDEIERGEREKVTDDLPISRGKKSKTDLALKKKTKPGSKTESSTSASSIISGAIDVVSGFRSDLSGAPGTSSIYKLGIILVFLMYISIVYYSTSLVFKVTKFELDVSKITGGFSLSRSIADHTSSAVIASSKAVSESAAGSSSTESSSASSSASSASAAASSSSEEASSDGDGDGAEGDDDDS